MLNLTSKSKSESLINKGKNVVSIFTKTLADLTANTEAIDMEDSRLNAEQDRMQAERDAMAKAKRINERISDNLETILGINGDEEDVLDSTLDSK